MRKTTIASYLDHLTHAARILSPDKDWAWLKRLTHALHAQAVPVNWLDRIVAPPKALSLGLTLMEEARAATPVAHLVNELTYRNGLILTVLSLWPLRRRSLAALTINEHIERHGPKADDGIWLLMHREDSKSGHRARFPVPAQLTPYLHHYLEVMRPRLLRHHRHNALWVSQRGTRLTGDAIYQAIRSLTGQRLGVPMGLHDFRRSAATFLALSEPEKIGLTSAVLQHKNPEVTEQHYNLAKSSAASKRHVSVMQRVFRNAAQAVYTQAQEKT